ncbi:MAG: long-chain fatty acid--CoA ligase [Deltaproteobacteria bacterium]|nr:long-chain fatty acid--CoA ligase [Deltaproteobacteria bacterium]
MATNIGYESKPWLKSYEKGVPESINYEEFSMPDYLEKSAKDFPDDTAMVFVGYKMTYSQFKDQVDRFATCLTDFGIKKGDAVSILLPNSIPCVVAYYSILKIGAIVVMNNPLYSDPELEHQFTDSDSKVLITLDALGNRMINLRPKTKIKQIVYMGIGDFLNPIKRFLGKKLKKFPFADVKAAPDVYRWMDCIAKYQPNPPKVKLTFDDIAMYQYTGGTTGVSKGVILTHGNLSKQVQQIAAWFPTFQRGGKQSMLGALPYFHVFGLSTTMNNCVRYGWNQILIPRPQPQPLLEAIREYKPTFTPLVPTMYIGMLNHPDLKKTDMSVIKGAFSGSAPLPVEIIQQFQKLTGTFISEGFGMTETCPVTHMNPFNGKQKVGSVGLPCSDTLARIVDLDNGVTDMPIGQPGELIVKGPQVMRGYKGMPEETANVLKDGWMYTGDIATMDEEGYFYIVDRKKDMIISGGYNVYPRDIDEVYYGNPKVEEACSIGIPDATRGENVKLFVVLKEGQTATAKEMIEYGKAHLAAYKLPSEVEFRKELPKTNVGKILRKELRAEELKKRKG